MPILRKLAIFTFLLMVLTVFAGCGSGSGHPGTSSGTGSIHLQIDLTKLSPNAARALAAKTTAPSITSVSATLSGDSFGPATFDLTVSGTTASGTITNLPAGYLHIVLNAYNGTTVLYTGSSDVKVVAGEEAAAQVLLDPVNSGSVSIDVGLNPYPGYRALSQEAGRVFYDPTAGRAYLTDATAGVLGVYNADMSIHLKDLVLPGGLTAIVMSGDGKTFFVGCREGAIYRLDVATGVTTLIVNVSRYIRDLVPVSDRYLLASTDVATYSTTFVVVDVTTGAVTATYDYSFSIYSMVFNPANGLVYAQDVNVSPQNIHRIQVDTSNGQIAGTKKSDYAGVYSFGTPLRIINNGSLVATQSGALFSSSLNPAADLIYGGSLYRSYGDLACDDALHLLYLTDYGYNTLTILRANDFGAIKTVNLPVTPYEVYQTADSIVVIGRNLGETTSYVRSFTKSELGLTGTP